MPAVGFLAEASSQSPAYEVADNITVRFVSEEADESTIKELRDKGDLVIETIPEDVADTAGCVWFAGLALSRYLASGVDVVQRDSRVCELGAGCCVPGLVSALLGAQSVCVTDLPDNIPHMKSIIESNKDLLACPVRPRVVEFGADNEFDTGVFDIILGADIGFDLNLHSLIKSTLVSLCGAHTRIILCEEVRWKDIFDWYIAELETCFSVDIRDCSSSAILGSGKKVKIMTLALK